MNKSLIFFLGDYTIVLLYNKRYSIHFNNDTLKMKQSLNGKNKLNKT